MRTTPRISTLRLFIYIGLLLSFSIQLSAANIVEPNKEFFELGNGLKVVLKPDKSMKLVSISSAFKFGAAHDVKGKDGLAHFTFMVADRVIKNTYASAYATILEKSGTSYTPEFGRETAIFTTTCTAEDIPSVLSLEAERMSINLFDPAEFDAVKRLKMSEFIKGTYDELLFKLHNVVIKMPLVTNWEYFHIFAGIQRDIQIARIQDIERFLTRYYSASNAALVIRGPIDPVALRKTIEEKFSILPVSNLFPLENLSFTVGPIPRWYGYPDLRLKFPAIVFTYPITPITHKDYPALMVLNHLLFEGKASFLGEYAVKSNSVLEYYTDMSDYRGANYLGAIFTIRDAAYNDILTDRVKTETERISTGKFSNNTLSVAKKAALKKFTDSLKNYEYTPNMSRLALILETPANINKLYDNLNKVTKAEVMEAAKLYLAENNRHIIYCDINIK
ncbi:MAG: insulinase family protein [Acidobacteria bacterium]|nr:insulinase family protein [Acidobacteriota bacterium]